MTFVQLHLLIDLHLNVTEISMKNMVGLVLFIFTKICRSLKQIILIYNLGQIPPSSSVASNTNSNQPKQEETVDGNTKIQEIVVTNM